MYPSRQPNPFLVIVGVVAGFAGAIMFRHPRLPPKGLPAHVAPAEAPGENERGEPGRGEPGHQEPDAAPSGNDEPGRPAADPNQPPSPDEVSRFTGHAGSVRCAVFLPNGTGVISGGIDAKLTHWDRATGAVVRTFPGVTDSIECVAVSADGGLVAAAGGGKLRDKKWVFDTPDFDIHLWDAAGRPLRTLHGHEKPVKALAFVADGRLISTGYDRSVRVWDVSTGAEVQSLEGHTNWVFALAVSPDGVLAASAGWDKLIRVWHLETGFELRTLKGHTGPVYGLAFSPDSRRLLSGSLDRTLRLWDVDAGKEVAQSPPQPTGVTGVAFLPDGRHALAATGIVQQTDLTSEFIDTSPGTDAVVRLWDLPGMTERHRFTGHRHGVEQVRASRDGRFAVSTGRDATARVWRVDLAALPPAGDPGAKPPAPGPPATPAKSPAD